MAIRLLLASVLALSVCGHANAASPRRRLHVSMYPFIPEAADAALTLKQAFERTHPDVIVNITFNANYYSPDPAAKGVLYEDADIHEIDSVFLSDFVARHKLAFLPASFVAGVGPFEPVAAGVGAQAAIPHWLCTDFLIYRADKSELADAHTLAEIEQAIGTEHGLLLDMSGDAALGELYDNMLVATGAALTGAPDTAILTRLRRILALEPAGFGRNPAYGAHEDFYARQFARRAGSAFVGYSELTHDILEETASGCRMEDRCVTAGQIRVAGFPFQDGRLRPAVWADMFGIDAHVHGQRLIDAQDFIRYGVSLPAYRDLLIPKNSAAPRYLLPSTAAAFNDAAILHAAPLYPAFRAILDLGVATTGPNLNARLHDVAAMINAALPAKH